MTEDPAARARAIIAARWPALLATLDSPGDFDLELCDGRAPTLRVNGVQLSSRHDHRREAEQQAAAIAEVAEINLYGAGLGDLITVLLERGSLARLNVRLLNRALFALALDLADQTHWLHDPRVTLGFAGEDDEIFLPFFALPPELLLAEDDAIAIRDRLHFEIETPFVNTAFAAGDAAVATRIESNRALFLGDPDVSALFGSATGRRALVIGAGPSLEARLDQLAATASAVDRPLIIAVDVASRSLSARGIVPDYYVSIDRDVTPAHLGAAHSAGVGLVYFPLVPNDTLHAWQGPRYRAASASPAYAALVAQSGAACLYAGGSVIHAATDLAVQMGAVNILFLGTDFCFPGGRTHSGWDNDALSGHLQGARRWLINGEGERVATVQNFASYLVALERYIARHPEVRFANSSRVGARIAGAVDASEDWQ